MAKRKRAPVPAPDYLVIVPPEFVAALDRTPADTTVRLGIADWWTEHDRPDLAAAWTWFAMTGKTPVSLTPTLCRTVDKELGLTGAPRPGHLPRTGYTAFYRRSSRWVWLGAGWGGTSVAPAGINRCQTHFLSRSTAASAIAGLVRFRAMAIAEKPPDSEIDWVDELDRLLPDAPERPVEYRTWSGARATYMSREEVFRRIRRLGGDHVVASFSGGHDSGGVDRIAVHFGTRLIGYIEEGQETSTNPFLMSRLDARTDDDTFFGALTTPVYNHYTSFNGEPVVGGFLTWYANTGVVRLEADETTSDENADGDDDSIVETIDQEV